MLFRSITYMFRIPTSKDEMIKKTAETINKLKNDGQEVAIKYRDLKERGKQKAIEAERMLYNATQRAKNYKKQAEELYQERAVATTQKTK